jgi:RHS repeat-associated protein
MASWFAMSLVLIFSLARRASLLMLIVIFGWPTLAHASVSDPPHFCGAKIWGGSPALAGRGGASREAFGAPCTLTYDPYGRVLSDASPGFQPFGFAGGVYDSDTGLVHYGVREYDAETGSFLRKDPSGFGGGTNLYAYAWGDPVNFVDVDGAVPSLAGGVIGAFEGALFGYVDEMLDQALDPERTGFDCAAVHSAMLKGALFGALTGGGGGGKRSGGGRGSCSGGLCEAGNC